MLTLPITFSLAPFPTGSALDADQYGQQLVANLTASFSGNFLTGQTGGTAPVSDIGPWFNLGQWYVWNSTLSAYAPLVPSYFYETPIINGRMQVWQRQINFPAVANGTYLADHWQILQNLSTGVATGSQSLANIPGTSLYPATEFSLKVAVTTAQPVIGASEVFVVSQPIEKQFARVLFNQPTTYSILIKSNVTGKYCISIQSANNGHSYVSECNVTSAGVFQRFEIQNIPAFPISANLGTLDTDKGYSVSICMACGTNARSLVPNSWQTGNFVGTVNQVNLFSAIGNTLEFTLVKHETGITATPYCPMPFDDVLRKCQRYFCQSYDYTQFAGQTGAFGLRTFLPSTALNTVPGYFPFPVSMRITPGVVTYSDISGVANAVRDNTVPADRAVSGVAVLTARHIGQLNLTSSGSANNIISFQFTATAEL